MNISENPFFRVNYDTKQIISRKIDRESDVFKNMIAPQIRLTIRLVCADESNRKRRSIFESSNLEDYHLLYLDDIPLKTDTTIVSVVIKDVNDNKPIFVTPSNGDPIGYPDTEINPDILPDYLIKVKAIDNDQGFNSNIKYSLEENKHFGIDSESGIIYPYSKAMKGASNIELLVSAEDRNGSEGSRKTEITLKIIKLKSENMALLVFKSSDIENFNIIQSTIKEKTGISLNFLKHSLVPAYEENDKFYELEELRKSKREIYGNTVLLRIWCYAFENVNSPMLAKDIKEALKDADEEQLIIVSTYSEVKHEEIKYVSKNTTGYIVSLSIISIISVGYIGFLIWWFFLKPYLQQRKAIIDETVSDKVDLFNNVNESPNPQSDAREIYKQRESMKIQGNTLNETSDFPKNNGHNRSSISSNESYDSIAKKRATVSFNELVERIHIEDEDKTNI